MESDGRRGRMRAQIERERGGKRGLRELRERERNWRRRAQTDAGEREMRERL